MAVDIPDPELWEAIGNLRAAMSTKTFQNQWRIALEVEHGVKDPAYYLDAERRSEQAKRAAQTRKTRAGVYEIRAKLTDQDRQMAEQLEQAQRMSQWAKPTAKGTRNPQSGRP